MSIKLPRLSDRIGVNSLESVATDTDPQRVQRREFYGVGGGYSVKQSQKIPELQFLVAA